MWKNSAKHYKTYFDADLFIVTLTYKDVLPDALLWKEMKMQLKKPFIHLNHEVSGLKSIDETGTSYNRNILRFFVYNKTMADKLQEYNDFRDYQIYYSKYQPRYGHYLRENDEIENKNQILWFLTWREYFEDDINAEYFVRYIKKVVQSNELKKYLKDNDLKLKICTHFLIEDYINDNIRQYVDGEYIELVKQVDTDTVSEFAKSKLLITDYSSAAYDFAFLNKPVILFQEDKELFKTKREMYYNEDEMDEYIIKTPQELISKLINEDYGEIPYLNKAFPDEIDYEYIKQDKHLDEIYDYIYNLQTNKITFLGYNFYGIGGTVNATMALAEGLLEQGYFVDLISLKRLPAFKHELPYGLNSKYLFWNSSPSIRDKVYRKLHNNPKYFSHLENDFAKKYLHPYVGYQLTDLMKNIKTNTIVSTRETLHLFLNDCTSEHVKNKIYFFHAPANMINNIFPNLIYKLEDVGVGKSIFVTNQNRLSLKELYGFDNYESYIILGNSLVSSKILDRDEIKAIDEKERYNAIYLLRVSKERKEDLDNLIGFAKYVKENNIKNISIDAFGDGDYVNEFIKEIQSENLEEIIHYQGATTKAIEEIRDHDFMIDFSLKHSFGMIYIEAILNGKKVFCMENPGSLDVMEDIPNSYITSYQWLVDEITNIHKIPLEELQENYDKIQVKYSRKSISQKFIDFLD